MQSGETTGVPSSSSDIQYWVNKSTGDVYAVRNIGGQKEYSGPLSSSAQQQSINSPQSLTFTSAIPSDIQNQPESSWNKLNSSEFQQQHSQVSSS
jgi:hypothetical protein